MRVPTYLNEENTRILEQGNGFVSIAIVDSIAEDELTGDLFEIFYCGTLFEELLICSVYDEEGRAAIPCKIVAKSVRTGKEILLFDAAKHGYNALFCDEFEEDKIANRSLIKLEIPPSKLRIEFAYGIDYESEKEDFEPDRNGFLETMNGELISWEDVKKNGFDSIQMAAIDEKGVVREFCQLELA